MRDDIPVHFLNVRPFEGVLEAAPGTLLTVLFIEKLPNA
jgi:hypothetical protein